MAQVNHDFSGKSTAFRLTSAYLCLTSGVSLAYGRANELHGRDRRCRIHRRRPRPRGPCRRWHRGRRPRLDARALAGGGAAPRRRRRVRERRRAARRRARRRRPRLHPEPPARGPRPPRAGRRQARRLREAARRRPRRRRAPRRPGRGPAAVRRGAVRLPLLPHRPRGAGAHRLGRERRRAPDPRHLPAGLAAERAGRQLARGRGPRGRVARLRRHRLALVRPRRVRHRATASPASARARPPRSPSASATTAARRSRAPTAAATLAGGHHRGRRRAAVRDRRRRARVGRHQPDLRRAQEPAVARGRRRGRGARASTRRTPSRCGSGAATSPC